LVAEVVAARRCDRVEVGQQHVELQVGHRSREPGGPVEAFAAPEGGLLVVGRLLLGQPLGAQPLGVGGAERGLGQPGGLDPRVFQGERLRAGEQVALRGLGPPRVEAVGQVVDRVGDRQRRVAADVASGPRQPGRLGGRGHRRPLRHRAGCVARRHPVPADEPRPGGGETLAVGDPGCVGLGGQSGDHLVGGGPRFQGGGHPGVELRVGQSRGRDLGQPGVDGRSRGQLGDDIVSRVAGGARSGS
jgi:hypothetical protein